MRRDLARCSTRWTRTGTAACLPTRSRPATRPRPPASLTKKNCSEPDARVSGSESNFRTDSQPNYYCRGMSRGPLSPYLAGASCFVCGTAHDPRTLLGVCRVCGMPLRVDYDLSGLRLRLTDLAGRPDR